MKVCKHIKKFLQAIKDVTLNERGWFENVTCDICHLGVSYNSNNIKNGQTEVKDPYIYFTLFEESENPNEYDIENIQDLINDCDWGRDIKLTDIKGKRIPKIELVEI